MIKKEIDEIFNKYIKIVWINPTTPKPYIPPENISLLKEEINKLLLERKKKL